MRYVISAMFIAVALATAPSGMASADDSNACGTLVGGVACW
jgi:hypothetical protein